MAHIPPLEGWYSRDSLCYGVGAYMAYITAKAKKNEHLEFDLMLPAPLLLVVFNCKIQKFLIIRRVVGAGGVEEREKPLNP